MEKNIWKSKFTQNSVSILGTVILTCLLVFCTWVMIELFIVFFKGTEEVGIGPLIMFFCDGKIGPKGSVIGNIFAILVWCGVGIGTLIIYAIITENQKHKGTVIIVLILAMFMIPVLTPQKTKVQYTCKAYHTDGKTSIIKPIKEITVSKIPKQLDDNFGDKTIYRCEVLKVDTIKE